MSEGAKPIPEKRLFVSDLKLGMEVADTFLLSAARQNQSANGPYWRLEFMDASGSMPGKIWSPLSRAYTDLTPGMAVHLRGRVGSYRERLELSIEAMRVLGEEEKAALDLSLFLPSAPRDPDEMFSELRDLAETVLRHEPWRNLARKLLDDPETGVLLRRAPAAKALHHAYAGGLLEHTLSVVRLCLLLADHYPGLDRQVLFMGALCHDLGKIWELRQDVAINYTTQGRLIGHINIFAGKLGLFAEKTGLENELAEHLLHLVLSHHGTHEFGSPRLPATPEALALHYADILDAQLKQADDALTGLDPGDWSEYNTAMERFFYCPPKSPPGMGPEEERGDGTQTAGDDARIEPVFQEDASRRDRIAQERVSEERMPDGQVPRKPVSGGQAPQEWASGERTQAGQAPQEGASGERTQDGQVPRERVSGEDGVTKAQGPGKKEEREGRAVQGYLSLLTRTFFMA
ncbi:MAG: HD domain-containing protein [Desulfovibrio sp.]|jgi:3'-5' exoribonuclease|nr:HD domain-containing protein [Desulfovibrio sp.]